MILQDKTIICKGRGDEFEIIPLGDIHIGARGCAEKPLKKQVKEIADNPNAYWIGGGDLLDAIKPQDSKRYDVDTMPDWMLEGDALTTREKLNDLLLQQLNRLCEILEPIKFKCIGCLEGNHEFSIRKYYNENIQKAICNRLDCKNLTDEAVIRLRFKRSHASATVIIYLRHGYGGGRTAGTEPMKLARMMAEWEMADICLTGHTHTFCVAPPKPVLEIPRTKKLPKELTQRYRFAANWGCWLYSHPAGPSSYASRACYPARPMFTVKAIIKPFHQQHINGVHTDQPLIELREVEI